MHPEKSSGSGVSTSIYLFTRRAKKNGTFAVKLRVIYNRQYHDYALGIDVGEDEFNRAMGERPRADARTLRATLDAIHSKARTAISEMGQFSFAAFETAFSTERINRGCVFDQYKIQIEDLKAEGKVKTSEVYRLALQSFQMFHKGRNLPFQEVTVDFLKRYETWMTSPRTKRNGSKTAQKANSPTTVSMYVRTLRTILNRAIASKLLGAENYPFGRYGYQVPASRNVKKALGQADISKLFAYKPEAGSSEAYYRDIWLFSYLCNGANMKDIARLRFSNIEGDRITFLRSKTETTSRKNLKPITVHLLPEAKEIIQQWGQAVESGDGYVFPVLPQVFTPSEEMAIVHQFTKQVNKYIGRIAEKVGISQHVTTYTARHSFATVLKRSNAPIAFISESLGHKDLRTTENYLDSFEDDTRKQWAASLTNFINQ